MGLINAREMESIKIGFFSVALQPNTGHGLLILVRILDHTQRRTTVGRTPLDE